MCLRLGADHDKPGPIAGNFEDRRIGIYGLQSICCILILRGSIVDDLDSRPRRLTAWRRAVVAVTECWGSGLLERRPIRWHCWGEQDQSRCRICKLGEKWVVVFGVGWWSGFSAVKTCRIESSPYRDCTHRR